MKHTIGIPQLITLDRTNVYSETSQMNPHHMRQTVTYLKILVSQEGNSDNNILLNLFTIFKMNYSVQRVTINHPECNLIVEVFCAAFLSDHESPFDDIQCD